jgi:hypothetical protein
VLYIPGGKGLKLMSFGYRNMMSNVLWFKTISYFGKHFGTDRNYEWLFHMCRLVSELNPKTPHVYKFCSMMLAWEANEPQKSYEILSTAIETFPSSWEFYYYRGILNYLFLKDENQSRSDLARAATLPNAPVVVQRLAAKKLAMTDPNTAIEFLKTMIEKSTNDTERKALGKRLLEAIYERDARTLEQAIAVFKAKTGKELNSLEQLVQEGIVSHLEDPFGGKYILDKESGTVVSSKGKVRISGMKSESAAVIRERWEDAGGTTPNH